MKRPCFALTLLLASLAGSLAAIGSANGQDSPGHAPYDGWHDVCPYAPGESSGSVGLCDDEDARWQAHQIEERYDYLRNYDEASIGSDARQEPTPATTPAPVDEPATPATLESAPAPQEQADAEFGYRSGYDYEYDNEVYPSESAEAPAEPLSARHENVEELDPYWTEGKLPEEFAAEEYSYEPEYNPQEYNNADNSNAEVANDTSSELDPYWTEGKVPDDVAVEANPYEAEYNYAEYNNAQNGNTSDELDPYWTEGKLPEDVAVEANSYEAEYNYAEYNNAQNGNTSDEIDPYWTEGKLPADVADASEELDPYWTNNDEAIAGEQTDEATIDPQWAKDAVETVESWIEKLNSREDAAAEAVENVDSNDVEPQDGQNQVTPIPSPEALLEKPAESADPTYGAHLWDDCDLDPQAHGVCERPTPAVTNYGAEPAPAIERNESFNVIEHRAWLLAVAHSLNEAGTALQNASESLVRIANDSVSDDSASIDGNEFEEYRD